MLQIQSEYFGSKTQDKEFSIILKFIDTKKDLSVQLHPLNDYARKYKNQNGSNVVCHGCSGRCKSHLCFEHPVTKEQLSEAVKDGTLGKHLHKVGKRNGDVYYVPAGTVHGIGSGTLIAEIQESSNVTYRVCDYDRVDRNGKKENCNLIKQQNNGYVSCA